MKNRVGVLFIVGQFLLAQILPVITLAEEITITESVQKTEVSDENFSETSQELEITDSESNEIENQENNEEEQTDENSREFSAKEEAFELFADNQNDTSATSAPKSIDPKNFLKSFQGKHDVDLFSGVLTYNQDLWIPKGRNGIQPKLTLRYNGNNTNFTSEVGYGWSF